MSLSMRRITRSASSVVDYLKEAAEKVEEEARQVAEKAAEEARKQAEEVQKAAEELARQTEEEAKRQAEMLAEQARKAEEEAKKAAEALKAAEEEAIRLAIEEAQKVADELKKQAEAVVKDQIQRTLNSVVGDVEKFTEEGRKFVKQIQDEINNLIELANIDALKRKLLDKAEQLSEKYLTNKTQAIAEAIQLAVVPDVKLGLETTEIRVEVFIYFVMLDDKDKDPGTNAIAVLTTDLKQNITTLKAPDVHIQFTLNKDRLEDRLREIIEEKIEKEKNKLIKEFLESFFSDYVVVFEKIINYLPK